MFCNDCCKVFCPRKSVDITHCDQKLTYVQAGIIDQPERKNNERKQYRRICKNFIR